MVKNANNAGTPYLGGILRPIGLLSVGIHECEIGTYQYVGYFCLEAPQNT